jgi:hypothetical protein
MATELTEKQIEEMKARHAKGEDIIVLARDYKIRNAKVKEICGDRRRKKKTPTTPEMKAEILKHYNAGLSPQDISKTMGITLGKAEYYAYGYDIKSQAKTAEAKKKIEYPPMVKFETCLIEGWRVAFDQDRKAGTVTTRKATPDELAKYSNVQGYKKPFVASLDEYWNKQRAM